MTDHVFDTTATESAQWARRMATELKERIGSPGAAKTTALQRLGYYRSVMVGDGPETPEELEQRIGKQGLADVWAELNADARRRARGR